MGCTTIKPPIVFSLNPRNLSVFFVFGFWSVLLRLPIMNVKIHGFVKGLSPFWCPAVCFRGSKSPNKLGERVITRMDLIRFPTERHKKEQDTKKRGWCLVTFYPPQPKVLTTFVAFFYQS